MRRSTRSTILAAGIAAAVALPASAQAAPAFTCEASALRGTVLGQAVEPVVYGRGQPCRTGQATPAAALPGLLEANVLQASGTKVGDAVTATGGLAAARVTLPATLPVQLPSEQVIANIQPVPVGETGAVVDIRDAVRAALPNGRLPSELLSTGVLRSVAGASCASGALSLSGSSTITGVKLLGRDLNLDAPVDQNINVIDSASIDPERLDLSKVVVTTPGLVLPVGPLLDAEIQRALDRLPTIEIPAAVAQVKLSAQEQTRDATSLTQRALRVQASLLGRSLVDVVIGEAKVSAVGTCAAEAGAVLPAELQCTDRKLVLLDVFESRGRVRLRGAADRDLVGKLVDIRYRAGGNKVVARARVARNGSFTTTAPLPRGRIRASNASRYTAQRGRERSLPLKLVRRMRTSSVTSRGGFVTIRGRITLPLASPRQEIRLVRRVACGKAQLIRRFKPRADGTFSVRVRATSRPAVYRATTRVRKVRRNPKTYPTFTLPRGVDLDQR